MSKEIVKDILCTGCGKVTPHSVRTDHAGEYVAECTQVNKVEVDGKEVEQACGRFLKFPAGKLEAVDAHIEKHNEANEFQSKE